MISVNPSAIYGIAEYDRAIGPVEVVVTRDGESATARVDLARFSPSLFSLSVSGQRYVSALQEDGTVASKPSAMEGRVDARSAVAGSRVLLFGTGFGPTDPATSSRKFVEGNPGLEESSLIVRIGESVADIEFAGLSGSAPPQFRQLVNGWPAIDAPMPGLFAILIRVPDLPSGDYPVSVEIGGVSSPEGFVLNVIGSDAPKLVSSASELRFRWRSGETLPESQTIEIASDGAAVLTRVFAGAPWISVAVPSSQTTRATFRISVSPGSLPPGTLTSVVRIASDDSANGTLTIPVTFVIEALPPMTRSVLPLSGYPSQSNLEIVVSGSGFAGASELRFTPADGITVSNVRVTDSSIAARLSIADNASVGPRQLRVIGPGGESGPVIFQIYSQTPVLSNVTIRERLTVSGSSLDVAADFIDGDGDLATIENRQAILRITRNYAPQLAGCNTTSEETRSTVNRPGAITGSLALSLDYPTSRYVRLSLTPEQATLYRYSVTLIDSSGKFSNVVFVPVTFALCLR